MYPFRVGEQYTRNDIFRIVGVEDPGGGSWYTGYTRHGDDHFVFCGVGTAGRTGHDYHNHFIGDELIWFGKNGSTLSQPAIQRLLSPTGTVYLFYREDDRSPFTFAGMARAKSVMDTSPVEVRWAFSSIHEHPEVLPNEIPEPEKVFEGAKKSVTVNVYERDPNARRKCIAHWGTRCVVCDFDFERAYGDLGKGFIHVHHLTPLARIGEQYELDPVSDLRPVCPNCHAMLHRTAPPLSVEALRKKVSEQGS